MNFVEPIRDRKKIEQIKNLLRGQRSYRVLGDGTVRSGPGMDRGDGLVRNPGRGAAMAGPASAGRPGGLVGAGQYHGLGDRSEFPPALGGHTRASGFLSAAFAFSGSPEPAW